MRTERRGRGGGGGVWLSLCVIPRVVYGVLGVQVRDWLVCPGYGRTDLTFSEDGGTL